MYDTNNKPNLQSPLILFATPPPLDQLSAVTICLSKSMHSVARFQPQVIKCREFIFTEPEIIGTPSADINEHYFHLVAKVSLMNSGRLQARLSRIGLEGSEPYPVSAELYESCLRYTLLARLSPSWNKAGPWLIQGRDFLTHRGCANAVKMDVSVHHKELFFTLEAAVLKLAPLQVTDLDIVGRHLERFLKNPTAHLDHDSIASDWCFILPSMKRGRIIRICHELPEDSPFMTYRDLKSHWKNTYGYRLPENEDDMNFYQINFGPLGGKLFTYPEVCLRGRDLQKMARVDPKPILRAFMQELQNKFPTVCGCPIKLQSKAKFPLADLLSSGQEAVQNQPNLTNKMNSSRPAVYRTKAEMERMLSSAKSPHPIGPKECLKSDCNREQVKATPLTVPGTVTSQPNAKEHVQQYEKNVRSDQKPKLCSLRDLPNGYASSIPNNAVGTPLANVTPIRTQQLFNSVHSQIVQHASQAKVAPTVDVERPSGNSSAGTSTDNSNFTSQNTDTPCHPSHMNNQMSVSRKLFPQFKPKKQLSQIQAGEQTASGKRVIPIFRPQKKPASVTVPKEKPLTTVNKPFIPHASTGTTAQGNTSKPSFHVSNVPSSCQKSTLSFNTATLNKTVPSFQKSGTPYNSTVVTQKDYKSGKVGKSMKGQKDKKPAKRPKAVKKDNQGESKKAKKMK